MTVHIVWISEQTLSWLVSQSIISATSQTKTYIGSRTAAQGRVWRFEQAMWDSAINEIVLDFYDVDDIADNACLAVWYESPHGFRYIIAGYVWDPDAPAAFPVHHFTMWPD